MLNDALVMKNQEELNLLKKTLDALVFQFVIVQYNHYSLVDEAKSFLSQQFPERTQTTIRLDSTVAFDFIPQILGCENGFIFLENAEQLLDESYKTISIGLNQRRDNFSLRPIQIVTFLPDDVQILRDFKTLLPDVYSIVNLIVKLKKQTERSEFIPMLPDESENKYNNRKEAEEDITRFTERLKSLDSSQENLALIIQLKYNLASAYNFLGEYDKALDVLKNVHPLTNPNA
jgi:tetratricopeptide (TPR) repeat protein